MNIQLTKIILSTLAALTIVACSGSGVGIVAGIGGSGFISSGTISGFGSVFVNGVEYETDSATFDVDGDPDGTEDDLAIGMVVQVTGTINDDGITGTATNISFDEELQGPVSSLSAPDADGITRSFTVLGATVIIDSSSTTFDIDSDNVSIPADTIFDFDTINLINSVPNVNNVEISGFFNQAGDLVATRVELKDIDFDTDSIVEVKGLITDYVNDSNFKVNGISADASGLNVILEPASLILANDLPIEIEGTLDATLTILTASRVEAEDDSVADTDEFELEGLITDYDFPGDTDFKVDRIPVDASGATFEPASLEPMLANDLRVEVEGAIIDGILVAEEIELEGGSLKVHAKVTNVNAGGNTFEVTPNPISGQTIIVTVTTGTQLENDVTEFDHPFTLYDLIANTDFVEVRGYDDGSGGITATEVEVKELSDVIVQGFATAVTGDSTGGTMTVLGVTFSFDDGSTTAFEIDSDIEGEDDIVMNTTQIENLINAIEVEPQLVKIEDKKPGDGNPVGTADEIEIESP